MSAKRLLKDKAVSLQSRAEAHLYVAIAKADGILSKKERAVIGIYAAHAQKLYDVLAINSDIARQVKKAVKSIIADARYHDWDTDAHLEEAMSLLKRARDHGNWSVALASLKHEHGLLQVAMLDEYIFAESAAVKRVLRRLERELGGGKH